MNRSSGLLQILQIVVFVVFLNKLKKLAELRSARAQNSSAHDSTVASINQLDAAHKRKPQETNNVRMLIILILFIFAFLNYCGLPVLKAMNFEAIFHRKR